MLISGNSNSKVSVVIFMKYEIVDDGSHLALALSPSDTVGPQATCSCSYRDFRPLPLLSALYSLLSSSSQVSSELGLGLGRFPLMDQHSIKLHRLPANCQP
jgi:hypothetical protein